MADTSEQRASLSVAAASASTPLLTSLPLSAARLKSFICVRVAALRAQAQKCFFEKASAAAMKVGRLRLAVAGVSALRTDSTKEERGSEGERPTGRAGALLLARGSRVPEAHRGLMHAQGVCPSCAPEASGCNAAPTQRSCVGRACAHGAGHGTCMHSSKAALPHARGHVLALHLLSRHAKGNRSLGFVSLI
eukprot:6196625-Pleurochrysis_carterae.AAC.2